MDLKNAEYALGVTNYEYVMGLKSDIIAGIIVVDDELIIWNPVISEFAPKILIPFAFVGILVVTLFRKKHLAK